MRLYFWCMQFCWRRVNLIRFSVKFQCMGLLDILTLDESFVNVFVLPQRKIDFTGCMSWISNLEIRIWYYTQTAVFRVLKLFCSWCSILLHNWPTAGTVVDYWISKLEYRTIYRLLDFVSGNYYVIGSLLAVKIIGSRN